MAKILIVDDHPANREFLVTLLGYKGHQLLEAGDGSEALELVRAERPDLVICDVLMPTMDGYEFVRQLRSDRDISGTLVIFYTAHYREREAQALAKTAGVAHVLVKPCEPELVLEIIDEALGKTPPPAPPLKTEAFDIEHLRLVTDKLAATVEDLRFANQRLTALIDLNLQLASQRDQSQLMNDVCRGARELLGARYGALVISGKETDPTAHFVTSGLNAESAARIDVPRVDGGILGEVHAQGRARRLRSPGWDPVTIGLPAGFPQVHSLLAAPLTSLSCVYGWICLTDKLGAEEFSAEDEQLLTILAAQVGRIYENGSLYVKIQRHATELQQEIVERKRVEEEIRETRNFLTSIFDNIPNSIFIKDARELRFVRVNPACEKLTGYQESELLGKSDYDFFPKDQADYFVAKDRETLASDRQVFIIEETITSRDGTEKLLQTKKFPILDKTGRPQFILGMSEDITDRKRIERALVAERTLLRTLIDALPDVVFTKDTEGRFTMCNVAGFRHSGFAGEGEIIGKSVFDFYPHDIAENYHADDLKALSGESVLNREEISADASGAQCWFLTTKVPLRDHLEKVVGLVGISRDITHRRSQEQKISRLSRIHEVLSGINSAIVRIRNRRELFQETCRIIVEHGRFNLGWIAVFDHGSGKLTAVAHAGLRSDGMSDFLFGSVGLAPAGTAEIALREKRAAVDNTLEDAPGLVKSGTEPDTFAVRRAAISLGAKSVIVLPLIVEDKTFGILTLYAPERNFFDEEEMKLLNELAGDISFGLEFIAKEEKVDYLAYYDPLTGLPNRTLFFDRLTRQLGSSARERSNVTLLLIDLDRFRQVNETLGRHAGDALLTAVAGRLNSTVRDRDSLAKVGSNRYALAISGNSNTPEVMYALESRNRGWFERPFMVGGEELRISASIGVAMFPADGENAESLFANAEAALRLAKSQSVPFLFYGPEMNARVAESLRLETRLRRAIGNQELMLWYQPKIDLKTGKITGLEALMRWRDPESGLVPPGKFIPVMEQTGIILDAGNWALAQVAVDCKSWVAQGIKPPRMAVNVSPIQLRQRDFVAKVISAAEEAEGAGGMLDLEITESVIMENVDAVITKLQTIRGLGVEIYIDDFGTGYSSLAYIARLPIHSLKIDRSFIVGMTQNQESLNIVNSVISLAHTLKLRVVAEGVETEAQADLLRRLKCDEMQGFLFSRPVPAEDVPALVRKHS